MEIIKLQDRYYCVVNEEFTYDQLESRFIEKSKTRKGSFADGYLKKIFKDMFNYAKDLKKEYLEYYSEEYDNFRNFLYQKELLDYYEIESLEIDDKQTLLRLQIDLNNYNMRTLLEYEDDTFEILNQIMEDIKE
ncbi:hypothetical protein [Acetobacterium tundrae]|uniref:Uncharacterized protein n=1 Tax=Acetobacterium tundrae TaxID=132932 RepID=A0ABR6WQ51_9FIRM|nr:hypothetical protein [Acetobacterium tundrae]MBC3798618.1 hypothetical protein [Acetobacterium tundrae]